MLSFLRYTEKRKTDIERSKSMVKIKVSYEHESELYKLKRRLEPNVKSVKKSNNQRGRYKKAYIELENMHVV